MITAKARTRHYILTSCSRRAPHVLQRMLNHQYVSTTELPALRLRAWIVISFPLARYT
jgi:hypothetical protein